MSFFDLLKSPASLAVIGTVVLGSTVGYIVVERPAQTNDSNSVQPSSTLPAPAPAAPQGIVQKVPDGFRVDVAGSISRQGVNPGDPPIREAVNKSFLCVWKVSGDYSCRSPDLSPKSFGADITLRGDPNDPTIMIVKGFFGDMNGTRYTWEQLKKGVQVSGLTLTARN